MAANNVWIIHFNVEVVDPVTKKKSTILKVVDTDGDYTEAEVREHVKKNFPNAKITKIEAPGSQSSSADAVKPPVEKPTEKPQVKPSEKPPIKPTEKPPVEKPTEKPTQKPPVTPPKKDEPAAPPDSAINDIVKKKEEEERIAKEVEAARERVRQKAEQERLEKERAEKERQQNQPAPVVPPKKEEPPKETPPAPVVPPKKEEPPKETPPATVTSPPATTPQKETPPAKTKEQKRAEVEAKLQELEKSNDPAVREQAAKIRKKLEGAGGSQQSDSTSTVPSKVPTPSDQIGGTSDKPSTNAGPGKTGSEPGNNQGPGKTTGDGNKPGNTTGNKTDAGKGKDEKGDKGPGTGTSGQGYWKDIGDNMVMWKGAPGTDSTFPGQSFKDGDIMPNPKYTVPTGGKGDDKYSSNNAEELRKQNRLKDEEIRKLKLRAGIK